ncbi:MAG: hypothetical protein IPL78_23200 [Chloroflexi bacterium]|nr:hypothetical protein [Chloroflexota bacterium]
MTFTDPELARVGLSESDLQEAKIAYQVRRTNFSKLDRAIANHQTLGSVKLLANADGGILGRHILGANAGKRLCLSFTPCASV